MRIFVLGLALGLTVACGASGLESMAIGTELVAKGLKAAKEANELMGRDRPQAAVIVMNRHLKEIDEAIQSIKNDPVITDRDKARVLVELQKYPERTSARPGEVPRVRKHALRAERPLVRERCPIVSDDSSRLR